MQGACCQRCCDDLVYFGGEVLLGTVMLGRAQVSRPIYGTINLREGGGNVELM